MSKLPRLDKIKVKIINVLKFLENEVFKWD